MSHGDLVVEVESVSKKFARGLQRAILYGFQDVGCNVLGRRARRDVLRPGEFWSLDDVSVELHRGEALGIVGANGAGKSTLLKLIAGLILPDRGSIRVRGRVGTLIEVGAGFHPMLSGRENIFVNGAVLGMSRAEVRAKFDAIVEFAGIGSFLDSPLKFYSSGMHVRLGFAVAAHLDPDVLIVDEILAVGDLAFRRRCQEQMARIRRAGTSILFVSHNSHQVQHLCDRALYLRTGRVEALGPTADVLAAYHRDMLSIDGRATAGMDGVDPTLLPDSPSTSEIVIGAIRLVDASGKRRNEFLTGETVVVQVEYVASRRVEWPVLGIAIHREDGVVCCMEKTEYAGLKVEALEAGPGRFSVTLKGLPLRPARYFIEAAVQDPMAIVAHGRAAGGSFTMLSTLAWTSPGQLGVCEIPAEWTIDG